jgi:hypothetical protein
MCRDQAGKVTYFCVSEFASSCDFSIGFWNCSDSVMLFVFYIIFNNIYWLSQNMNTGLNSKTKYLRIYKQRRVPLYFKSNLLNQYLPTWFQLQLVGSFIIENRYSLFYQHSVQAWTKSFTIYSTSWKQDRYRTCYVLFGFVNCKHNILKQTINISSFLKRVILKIVQNICEWKLKTIHWLWLVYYNITCTISVLLSTCWIYCERFCPCLDRMLIK